MLLHSIALLCYWWFLIIQQGTWQEKTLRDSWGGLSMYWGQGSCHRWDIKFPALCRRGVKGVCVWINFDSYSLVFKWCCDKRNPRSQLVSLVHHLMGPIKPMGYFTNTKQIPGCVAWRCAVHTQPFGDSKNTEVLQEKWFSIDVWWCLTKVQVKISHIWLVHNCCDGSKPKKIAVSSRKLDFLD